MIKDQDFSDLNGIYHMRFTMRNMHFSDCQVNNRLDMTRAKERKQVGKLLF